jgi:hypothetical protein
LAHKFNGKCTGVAGESGRNVPTNELRHAASVKLSTARRSVKIQSRANGVRNAGETSGAVINFHL